MKGVIIAAGRGGRLQRMGPSKPLVALLGKPLLQHVIERALEAGLDELLVVVGHRADLIEAAIAGFSRALQGAVRTIDNPEWARGNGTSVYAAARRLDGPYLLMMADHLQEPATIGDLAAVPLARNDMILAVDRRLDNPLVDPEDVTRVETENGRIVSIGKHLERFDAYDTGLFLCAPSFRLALDAVAGRGGAFGLSDAVQEAADGGRAGTFEIGRRFWIDIDDEEMLQRAREHLHRQA